MNNSSLIKLHLFLSSFLIVGILPANAQDFPNALALIEYLQGVQKTKVPDYLSSNLIITDLTTSDAVIAADEYFKSGEEHYVVYKEGIGLNAKINRMDSLTLYLKGEIIYETERIDIENFLYFGIFNRSPQEAVNVLRSFGIDTDYMSEAIRLGRPMWIIGADRRDSEIPQLWIDKKFHASKKLHYLNLPQGEVQQMEFDDYMEIEGFHLPQTIEVKKEPETMMIIKRSDIEVFIEPPVKMKTLLEN